MSQSSLTDTQLVILSAAAQREDLRIELPERLRGGVARAVLSTLLSKSLIEILPGQADNAAIVESAAEVAVYRISRAGLAALGIAFDAIEDAEQQPEADEASKPLRADFHEPDAEAGLPQAPAFSSPRAGTKLADVIGLLERPKGASIDELTASTGWLPHTTRAALTGLRKRGIGVDRAKSDDGITVYRIAPASSAKPAVEAA